MTEVDCPLQVLLETRTKLRQELPRRLSSAHRQFLSGLARVQPDWSLLQCPHADQLPALRWKLANLATFQKCRPKDFAAQADRSEERRVGQGCASTCRSRWPPSN